jgi:putative transposase
MVRYRLPVLGYAATCNHIHILVQDPGVPNAIWRSMQLIQGRTAQSYNRSRERSNAFWGDRYHATAVESGTHLRSCLTYIDLNMVRAHAVAHPRDWPECGYAEICDTRLRSPIIDRHRLAGLLGCSGIDELSRLHREAIEEALGSEPLIRDDCWTEAVAVGSQHYLKGFASALGNKLQGREIVPIPRPAGSGDNFVLRETGPHYGNGANAAFRLTGDNTVFWQQ